MSEYELNPDVTSLHRLISTEVNCPEILPYRQELVESLQTAMESASKSLKKQLKKMESTASTSDDNDEVVQDALIENQFQAHFYQMDIERIRYALARYLRTRVQKIESSLDYIHSDLTIFDRLSEHEKHFANKVSLQLFHLYIIVTIFTFIFQQPSYS